MPFCYAKSSAAARGFPNDGTGRHDPRRAESNMGRANIAAREHQIVNIDGVQRTERNMVDAVRIQMLRAAFRRIHALRRMQINRPAAKSDAVFEGLLRDNIVLIQHVVPDENGDIPVCLESIRSIPASYYRHQIFPNF